MSIPSIVRVVSYGVFGALLGVGGIHAAERPLLFCALMGVVITIDIASSFR